MKIRLIPGRELNGELIEQWSALQASNPDLCSPYFCPEFTAAVAAVREDVFVGVLEEGNRVTGFFPFQRGALGAGKPVGGRLSDYHGVIAAREAAWDVRELLRGCRLRSWDFDHLIASQAPFAEFHAARDESPILDLSAGFAAYEQKLKDAGSGQLKNVYRMMRKLAEGHGPYRFDFHSTSKQVLGQVIDWKAAQCRTTGSFDYFALDWTRELVEQIQETQTPHFGGLLSAIFAGDELVAAHFGMRSGSVWHWWFPTYNEKFADYSPGVILLIEAAKAAAANGIRHIDLGKGMSLYKKRVMTGSIAIAEGRIEVPSALSVMRKARESAESFVRQTPLKHIAKIPGRWIHGIERKLRFR